MANKSRKLRCKHCGTMRVVSKTSNFIGVDLYKSNNKWRARATDTDSKTHSLGYYHNEKEAAIVYDNFILNNKIPNRPLNFPKRLIDEDSKF